MWLNAQAIICSVRRLTTKLEQIHCQMDRADGRLNMERIWDDRRRHQKLYNDHGPPQVIKRKDSSTIRIGTLVAEGISVKETIIKGLMIARDGISIKIAIIRDESMIMTSQYIWTMVTAIAHRIHKVRTIVLDQPPFLFYKGSSWALRQTYRKAH